MDILKIMLLYFGPEDVGGGSGDAFDPGTPIDDSGSDDSSDNDSEEIVEDTDDIISDDSDSEDIDDSDDEESDESDEDEEDEEETPKSKKVKKEADEDEEADVDPTDASINANIVREAAKKYPGIFKQFPELKAAFFYGRNVRAMFPTIEDAAEAAETVKSFEYIQNEVSSGNPDSIVQFLKNDGKTLHRFSAKFIQGLAKASPEVYANVTAPILTGVLRNMMKEAKVHNNKNMELAAKWVSQYVFDSAELPDDPKVPEGNENANPQVNELLTRQFTSFREDLRQDTAGRLKTIIDSSLAKVKAPVGVKRTIAKDTQDIIGSIIGQDKAHLAYMDSLWQRAKRNGFTRQDSTRIREAYLDAVKRVFPGAREKALKQNGFSIKKSSSKNPIKVKSSESDSPNRSMPVKKTSPGGRKIDTSGMNEVQFLEHLEKNG